MKHLGIKIGIVCLLGILAVFLFRKKTSQGVKDTAFEEVLTEPDASTPKQTEEILPKDNLLSTLSQAKIYKEYKLQDVLKENIKITKEDIERALKNLGRSADNLLAASLLMQFYGGYVEDKAWHDYLEEGFAKEKTRAGYYLMTMSSQDEKLIEEFKAFDPNNVLPEMLLFNNLVKKGIRIDVGKLEYACDHKTLVTGSESITEAGRLILENIGFEKEAAELMTHFIVPSSFISIGLEGLLRGDEEWYDGPKHQYTDAEKITVMKSIQKIYSKKTNLIEDIIKVAFDEDIAKLEKNKEKVEKAKLKEECLNLVRKEVPLRDFTYIEAKDFTKDVKEKGETAAYFNYPGAQHALESKGCLGLFPH